MLKNLFKQINIEISEKQLLQFEKYFELLVEWNEKINLTAITQREEVYLKHFVDSAICLCDNDIKGDVIDVGTGAGFPGLVIKILRPEINLTLLDSLNKRIEFLKFTSKELGLENINFIHSRAEDGGREKDLRESFDFAMARAVANLSTLSEYCLPFVKKDGVFISMKGPDVTEEIKEAKGAVNKLGGEILGHKVYNLPDSDINHSVITIKKLRQTPSQYPRKAGKPSKEPLK